MRLIILPEADEDTSRLYEFLEDKNPLAAQKAMLAIDECIETLLESPYIGVAMPDRPEYRQHSKRFGKRAYILRYRIDEAEDVLVIVRIWHSREGRT